MPKMMHCVECSKELQHSENHKVFHCEDYQWFPMDVDLYNTLLAMRLEGEISANKALRRVIEAYQEHIGG
jgi:hypothetical protein